MKTNYRKKTAPWLRRSKGEKVFTVFNVLIMLVLIAITLLPMWHVFMGSLSDPVSLFLHHGVALYPIGGISLDMYKNVITDNNFLTGYGNTIFYAVFGTLTTLLFCSMGAYTLCRRRMLNNALTTMLIIPMFFGGGLIPTYLVMRMLGLLYTRTIMILMGSVSLYYIIVLRTAFSALPDGLIESAKIDGAGDFMVLFRIVLPLTKATLAVIGLFSVVGHWNSWYTAYIYLKDDSMMPLQIFLRRILLEKTATQQELNNFMSGSSFYDSMMYVDAMQYTFAMVATLPILVAYPFVQRYFVKGVMIGAIKG